MKRRDFIKNSWIGAYVLPSALGTLAYSCAAEKQLNILVLGGTYFLGPAIVNAALSQGHNVTLFNRGKTNPDLFVDLTQIKGDRNEGIAVYDPIKSQHWDIVIDVWPEQSKLVDEATRALYKHTDWYVFISSIAVYDNFQEIGLNEESVVVKTTIPQEDWHYPEQKVAAEQYVREKFPDKHTILRPGPIKGWRDPELDLLYWLVKLKRNEDILGPGTGNDPLQFIDVKAVGQFAIDAVENKWTGTFNATGPGKEQIKWKEFLSLAKTHLKSTSAIYWPDEAFLRSNGVRSFEHLPLWAPLSEDRGFMQISMEKSNAIGFKYIPIEDTIDDCLSWFEHNHELDFSFGIKNGSVGLDKDRELELLKLWRSEG